MTKEELEIIRAAQRRIDEGNLHKRKKTAVEIAHDKKIEGLMFVDAYRYAAERRSNAR